MSWRDLMAARSELLALAGGSTRAGTTAGSSSSTSGTRAALPARDQPGARAGGGRGRTRFGTSSSSARRARSSGGHPRTSTRTCPRARSSSRSTGSRSSPARRRCRSSWTRTAWTRRCGFVIAGSTCGDRRSQPAAPCRPGFHHPPGDGGRRLPGHPDADPLQADARRCEGLHRPEPPAGGPLLRAPAVAADPQAAARDRRLRPVLPDRHLLPGRGPESSTGSRRSPSSMSRWPSRTRSTSSRSWRQMCAAVWRDGIGAESRDPLPQDEPRRGPGPLRKR